jgi:hypothetical protein
MPSILLDRQRFGWLGECHHQQCRDHCDSSSTNAARSASGSFAPGGILPDIIAATAFRSILQSRSSPPK